jgi:hypothetical protein
MPARNKAHKRVPTRSRSIKGNAKQYFVPGSENSDEKEEKEVCECESECVWNPPFPLINGCGVMYMSSDYISLPRIDLHAGVSGQVEAQNQAEECVAVVEFGQVTRDPRRQQQQQQQLQ